MNSRSVLFSLRFFFSSRIRHTRFDCDWSSDVCSSDLGEYPARRRPGATPDPVRSRLVRQSNQTEVPKRLFDGLALFGRARFDATTLPGAVRCTARWQASKRLDMSDPTGLRDEAVMFLNELLYLNVGRHSCHPRARARA